MHWLLRWLAVAAAATVATGKSYAAQRAALLESIGEHVTFDSVRRVARGDDTTAPAHQQQPAAAVDDEGAASAAVESLAELSQFLPPATVVDIAQSLNMSPLQIARVFRLKPLPRSALPLSTTLPATSPYEVPSPPQSPQFERLDPQTLFASDYEDAAAGAAPTKSVAHSNSDMSLLELECQLMQQAMQETVRKKFPHNSPESIRAMVARMDVQKSCAETLLDEQQQEVRGAGGRRAVTWPSGPSAPRPPLEQAQRAPEQQEASTSESILASLLQAFPPEKFLQAILGRGLEVLAPPSKRQRSEQVDFGADAAALAPVRQQQQTQPRSVAVRDEDEDPHVMTGVGNERLMGASDEVMTDAIVTDGTSFAPPPTLGGNSKKKKGDFFISFGGSWDKDMFRDKSTFAPRKKMAIDPLALLTAMPKGKKHGRNKFDDDFANLSPPPQAQPLLVAPPPLVAVAAQPIMPVFAPPPQQPLPRPPPQPQIIKNPIDIIEYVDVVSSPAGIGGAGTAAAAPSACSTGNCVRVRYESPFGVAGSSGALSGVA